MTVTAGVAVVLAGYALLLLMLVQQGRALPGTSVDGISVGGLEAASIRRVLSEPLAERASTPVMLVVPGDIIPLDGAAGQVAIDLEATVARALARGRTGTPTAIGARLGWSRAGSDLRPVALIDETAIATWVEGVADRLDRSASVGDVRIDGAARTVDVIPPLGALTVDRAATTVDVIAAVTSLRGGMVGLVFDSTPPPAPASLIQSIASDIRQGLDSPPVLIHRGRRLELTPITLARVLDVVEDVDTEGRPTPALRVREDVLALLVGREARAVFDREAVDAHLSVPRVPAVTLDALGDVSFRPIPALVNFDAGSPAVSFDAALTARRLEQALAAGRTVLEAGVHEVPADLSADELLRGLPTHLLGTFTTYFTAGAARNDNIRLLADTIDDRLLAPGEEFSINATSGPRRCEDGYVLAGAIIRGELVPTCGGGVSQLGTTVYNAAFFAGVPILEWQPHSYFISRYPPGREATLNYGTIDVRFVNATKGWLLLRTAHTDTSVSVSLYGVPAWAEVAAVHGPRRADTDYPRVERIAPDLGPGARRIVQAGGGGFTITVDRTLTPLANPFAVPGGVDTDAEPLRERSITVYRPQTRIVEVGRPS
jgi:hypothetical protein